MRSFIFGFLFILLLSSCDNNKNIKLFSKLAEDKTGINFRNLIKEDNPEFNVVLYPYFYNGSGVCVGDINNDGLMDICLTGNMVKNRLYLNKGNWKFEDITEKSGIAAKQGWCTGATMADVNGDGWMDIYICRSGLKNESFRKNLLYLNNGDQTFTEKAAEYGLDDAGYSTQASFFDYDKDGDLDMMLINQSLPEFSKGKIEYVQMRNQPADSIFKNKLFRNNNGHFVNVSAAAGITSNALSFSLGISTTDLNNDGWPDIYVANDFKEPDYYFVNNKNGTFTEQLNKSFSHTSLYSMGIDAADYNNDALPDLVELDMLPEGNKAQKMHMGTDGFDQYDLLFRKGMPYQYMKNSFQKNNGDGTFSEIGQLLGVANTDWSWSPLLCDFDNDGWKDLFISNGYKRDNTDIQFVKYSMDQSLHMNNGGSAVSVSEYISHMPSIKIENYIFQNTGKDQFINKINDWGLEEKNLSHGAAYADLDNDGDMDLIINNTDDYAGIYENNTNAIEKNNYLKIQLKGSKGNSLGTGTKVSVMSKGKTFYQEQNTVRGYCSSIDPVLNFGLGKISTIDSVIIQWNDDKVQVLKDVKTNQLIVAKNEAAVKMDTTADKAVKTLLAETINGIDFKHKENEFNDFNVQTLLPCYLSRQGPCMAKADVNKDGKEDVFIGGAAGQPAQLFIQAEGGTFKDQAQVSFVKDALCEDVAATFLDADNDGDMDLYVCSGGYEFVPNDALLQDRLYINDGKGNFSKKADALPVLTFMKSCVAANDVDADGDIDLFIGGRCISGRYPEAPGNKLLLNDGKGNFTEAPNMNIANNSMVTDAKWLDVNNDKVKDLVLVGEWMSPKIFINDKGKLTDGTATYFSLAANGWWNTMTAEDMDNDGDIDLILGNQGLNNQFAVSAQEPASLYYKDFDGNGSIDPILFYYISHVAYPAYSRDDMAQQLPILNKRFLFYNDYALVTKADLFTAGQLKNVQELTATSMQTIYLENSGKGFVEKPLPIEVQYAPVYAIAVADVNHDGNKDIVLAGNNTFTRIRFGRYDANHGTLLLGNGKGEFAYVPQWQSGLNVQGNTRSILQLDNRLFFGINNEKVTGYSF